MEFEGWQSNQSKLVWTRESRTCRAIVSRIDGWNWGWIAVSHDGDIFAGRLSGQLELADAINQANQALARIN